MDEINLIQTLLAPLAGPEGLGLQDDAALFRPEPGQDLVFTKDTLVEGVHFPKGQFGRDVAEKLIRVNLSDLAAKGAQPKGYLLSLALRHEVDNPTLTAFAHALGNLQQIFDFTLFGGDTVSTEGPIVVSATFVGQVPSGKMVRRNGARPGDDVWISGFIGDGFLGLKTVLADTDLVASQEAKSYWLEAYWRPKPRIIMRQMLMAYASAATDVSDGLISDLNHICLSSRIGMKIQSEQIPFSPPTTDWLGRQLDEETALVELITAGDDYEVAFTAPPEYQPNLEALSRDLGLRLARIGQCLPGSHVTLVNSSGREIPTGTGGYVHFQEKTR